MRFLLGLLLLSSLTACASLVPANEPLQLDATAGAAIRITDEMVDAGFFTVNYPDGWRVVKLSIAVAPLQLVFVAPDETMRIEIEQTDCIFPEATPEFGSYWPQDCRSNDEINLRIAGFGERENREHFDQIFVNFVQSIQFR